MRNLAAKKRRIAVVFLLIWIFNLTGTEIAWALTSGPSQPEAQKFQQAGVSDMVDMQNGGLKYNIPLIDIDGYPINLNYQSGTGIDDEASWVGLGWNLNPGAINRQVRGIPDDFNADTIESDHYVKPKVTVGGRLTAKVEYGGLTRTGLNGSFTFGVFSDNYTGIGAELGVNAGISYSLSNDGGLTAGLGTGVISNTQSGVDASVSPYVSMSVKEDVNEKLTTHAGLSGSFGYNSRSGLKGLTLGASFGISAKDVPKSSKTGEAVNSSGDYNVFGSTISYNTQNISPSIKIPFTSNYDSFSFDLGGEVFGVYASGGGTGYQSVRSVSNVSNPKPAYGYLYSDKGKNNQDAVMDFIREQDNAIVPGLTNIAIPINTPDIWSYSSQGSSGQFRLYRGGSGAFFDNQSADISNVHSNGGDIGFGAWFHGGVTHYQQETHTKTHKWVNDNTYLAKGDFQDENDSAPGNQHVFFRQVGEKNLEDTAMNKKLYGTQPLQVGIGGTAAHSGFHTQGNLYGAELAQKNMVDSTRRHNRTVISYLTAREAGGGTGALDDSLKTYAFFSPTILPTSNQPLPVLKRLRKDSVRRSSHISEITVTDDGGKRLVYGMPVYNYTHDEYTFAVGQTGAPSHVYSGTNQVAVPANPARNNLGVDNYYMKEHKSPYATSFLLTGILSPDYVDKTGNGISPDDLGTALKLNYSRIPVFRWRTPIQNATLNKFLLADADDDKGSIVYGTKELYYVSSIESKTKIAYFITQDRRDALGVKGWQGNAIDTTIKQKCLVQIRLYSKGDMTRPIKVVNFKYDYELCKGIPNSADYGSAVDTLGGKLTLKKVWFTYGNSTKGIYHPYTFQYNRSAGGPNITYGYMVTDRWGTYKQPGENSNLLDNEQYPYTNQNKTVLDANTALWHLNKITLPTGGVINISLESNDYAYVQNQKAMVMTGIESLIGTPASADTTALALKRAHGIRLNIGASPPAGVDPTSWFERNYLDGSDYIYTKLYVKIATGNTASYGMDYDYVPCYAHVSYVTFNGNVANIMLTDNSGVVLQHQTLLGPKSTTFNPMCIAAWQRLKNEYPKYAYPGYDNRVTSANSSILGAVSAIVNAAKNLTELKKNFYQTSFEKGYCSQVDLSKSFVKITKVNGYKLGGGARVKKIQINDSWTTLSGNSISGQYGQTYNYTTIDNGQTISSGVATYEPSIGNDENALKQPVPYVEKIQGALNNYFDLEKPFCESLFPSPEIGYSKVTSQDIDRNGNIIPATGTVINEYYTAKDFPVIVTALPLSSNEYKPSSYYTLMKSNSIDDLTQSQGYTIQLNDMHGKLKATRVLNQSGAEISSSVYYYGSTDNGGVMSLNNQVSIVKNDGTVLPNQTMGREIEFFTDFREQQTINQGKTINIGVDIIPTPFIFLPFLPLPHFPIFDNNDYKQYRSASALKVIQSYGILSKVVKTQNGSSISTENLAYDPTTGEPMVTRTQNEFKQYIYSVNLPAYWVYPGMGAAYQNLGLLLQDLPTNAHGEISNSNYFNYLSEGDELIDVNSGSHYWVINNMGYPQYAGQPPVIIFYPQHSLKLIDQHGKLLTNASIKLAKVIRSGFRNMLNEKATTIVCLTNPINSTTNKLAIILGTNQTSLKVINASANTYNQSWGLPMNCNKLDSTTTVNPNPIFTYEAAVNNTTTQTNHGIAGAYFIGTGAVHDTIVQNSYLKLGLQRAGIWANSPAQNIGVQIGFTVQAVVPQGGTYYVGYSGDDEFHYSVDGTTLPVPVPYANSAHVAANYWFLYPIYLSAGGHQITASAVNYSLAQTGGTGSDNTSTNPGGLGLEIYSLSRSALISGTSSTIGVATAYSTSFLINTSINSYEITSGGRTNHFTYNYYLNPFIDGFLGNWRPYKNFVYQQNRSYSNIFSPTQAGINVKNAGFINNYYNYWFYDTSVPTYSVNPNGKKYVAANTVTQYDQYGQQQENMDALGRFSSAKFDFNGELPSAVCSNAMKREIFAESFEDARFTPGASGITDSCNARIFQSPTTRKGLRQMIIDTISHSGNYCALLPTEGVNLSTNIYKRIQRTDSLLKVDSVMEYQPVSGTGIYPNGFEPYPGKQYIFDAWVKDGHSNDKSVNETLTINGTAVPLVCRAVVENWKLVEGVMKLSTLGSATVLNVAIAPKTGFTVFIDDIRMHPYDAQMKTYVYDDKTMRLMAEIDENGFATFYEYDDEGLLIRVKKETEKGVMTIKETRSSYRQHI